MLPLPPHGVLAGGEPCGPPTPSKPDHSSVIARVTVVRRLVAEHAHRYIFASAPNPFVEHARPRTVNPDELKREMVEWQRWHAEQTAAERKLMGW